MINKQHVMEWHVTQNREYLELCQKRLEQPILTWVNQFIGIINEKILEDILIKDVISINDFGCNVGHFFRGIKNIKTKAVYHGYDISQEYLKIAKKNFGTGNFSLIDISQINSIDYIDFADVSVISATLEHIENYEQAIKNIFDRTQSIVIIRTFIGDTRLKEICRTNGAEKSYLIRQFKIQDFEKLQKSIGWSMVKVEDIATSGQFKFVCNNSSIRRKQEVIIFQKDICNE